MEETILILDSPKTPIGAELEVYAANGASVRVIDAAGLSSEELEMELGRAWVLQTWRAPVDAAMLERARRCLLVVQYGPGGAGAPAIDMEVARRLGIYVTSIPDFATDDWADETVLLMLDCLRRTPGLPLRSLDGLRMGLIGMGQVGRTVARRAKAFGMDLWGYDPFAAKDIFENEGVRPAPLAEVLGIADVVSLHLPLTDATEKILSAPQLRVMQRGSILICTADPGLVDLDALAGVMRDGRVAAAAFDDDLAARLPQGHALLNIPALRHGPRRAGTSRQCAEALRRRAAQVVLHMLRGNRPTHLQIDPACPRHILQLAGQDWDESEAKSSGGFTF